KLNAAEEDRHKDVLLHMLAAYGIRVAKGMQQKRPLDPELGFLRTGYGECINSFFAFGLFEMARRSGFFPPAPVDTFEPIVQEEARHILFFANYLAHRRATLGGLGYLTFQGKCVIAILEQIMSRLSMAIRAQRSARQTIDRGSMRSDFLNDGARS